MLAEEIETDLVNHTQKRAKTTPPRPQTNKQSGSDPKKDILTTVLSQGSIADEATQTNE